MDQELKTRWIEALRSGKHEQGTVFLCKDGYCCCIGVLAEIDGKLVHDNSIATFKGTCYMSTVPINYCDINENQEILARMNDFEGKTFNEIADWIEENL